MMEPSGENAAEDDALRAEDSEEAGPARALTLHLLRMLETRMDAAGIALQSEVQDFSTRIQLKLLGAAALFIAIWGGIVLLAIALPEHLRIPVLAGVVAAFVACSIWALLAARRKASETAIGSLRWFLDGLKLDLEVLARSLAQAKIRNAPRPVDLRSPPSDLAA